MIPLHEVQQNAKDLIAAAAYFSAEDVLVDVGLSEPAIEDALAGRGFAVSVPPILGASLKSQGKDNCVVDADLMVSIWVNPKTNATPVTGAGKDTVEAIEKVVAAVLEFDHCEKVPNSKFRLAPEAFSISVFDGGLFAYDIFFNRLCVL